MLMRCDGSIRRVGETGSWWSEAKGNEDESNRRASRDAQSDVTRHLRTDHIWTTHRHTSSRLYKLRITVRGIPVPLIHVSVTFYDTEISQIHSKSPTFIFKFRISPIHSLSHTRR